MRLLLFDNYSIKEIQKKINSYAKENEEFANQLTQMNKELSKTNPYAGKFDSSIGEDGVIGPQTINAMKLYLSFGRTTVIIQKEKIEEGQINWNTHISNLKNNPNIDGYSYLLSLSSKEGFKEMPENAQAAFMSTGDITLNDLKKLGVNIAETMDISKVKEFVQKPKTPEIKPSGKDIIEELLEIDDSDLFEKEETVNKKEQKGEKIELPPELEALFEKPKKPAKKEELILLSEKDISPSSILNNGIYSITLKIKEKSYNFEILEDEINFDEKGNFDADSRKVLKSKIVSLIKDNSELERLNLLSIGGASNYTIISIQLQKSIKNAKKTEPKDDFKTDDDLLKEYGL